MVLLAAWLGLTGISLARYWFEPAYAHEDLRGTAALIAERESGDDAVLVPAVGQVFRFYYRGHSPWSMMSYDDARRGGRDVDTALDQLLPSRRFLWFVRSRPWFGDPQGAMARSLQGRHLQLGRFELAGVEVLLFDRGRPPLPPEAETEATEPAPPETEPDSIGRAN